eukprot:758729-Rhodomonas_salina.3
MGQELFGTFTKGNAGAWMAATGPGIEEDKEYEQHEWDSAQNEELHSFEEYKNCMASATRPDLGLNQAAWLLFVILSVLNTVWIEICNTTACQYAIILILMMITANVGPSMIIWVTVGALLSTCKQLGRQTVADINDFYYPSLRPVYQLKHPGEPVRLKSR